MKQKLHFIVLTVAILIVQMAPAQDRRDFKTIAFDYLVQNIGSDIPWRIKTENHDMMPNGDCLVKLTISRTLTVQEEGLVPNQVHYWGSTFNVGVRKGYIYRKEDDTRSYFVFVDRYGVPHNYMESSNDHEFYYWGGKVWLIMNNHTEKVGTWSLTYHSNIACFSNIGETMWIGRDMKIYGWAFTGNTLYMVGTLWKDGRSIVRSIDVNTLEPKDKLGSSGVIPSSISFEEDGLRITQVSDNGISKDYIFPYAARDRQFQIDQVLKKYDLNKASDQIALGERYLNGNIVDKDEKKAFELFEKAANQNNDIGVYKLATCYKNGIGVKQDYTKASSLMEKSANLGNTEAMRTISEMYAEGDGVQKNLSKALYWKEMLAFSGDMNAQKEILANQSVNYEKYDISGDEAFKKATENHQNNNYEWAKYCYERSISKGNRDAMLNYGKWLYEANGIKKDCGKAIELLNQLGEEGNVNAQKILISIYRDNNGVVPDINKEIFWTKKAADKGDVDSQLSLGNAYQNGLGIKKDKHLAFAMYEKAAKKGSVEAIKEMVYRYTNGNGVKKNYEIAEKYFQMLPLEIQDEVADVVYWGRGIKKNKKMGLQYFALAARNGNQEARNTFWNLSEEKRSVDRVFRYGLSVGYVQKKWAWEDSHFMNGVQVGFQYKPWSSNAFSFGTGVFYEYYNSNHTNSASNYDYDDEAQVHAICLPAHFEYNLSITDDFLLLFYGGVSLDYNKSFDSDDYNGFNFSLDYGCSIRYKMFQLNFARAKGLFGIDGTDSESKHDKPLMISLSYMF